MDADERSEAMNTTLKTKTPLARRTPLKAKTGLKSNSSLKARRSLRDSYAEKIKSGEKKVKTTQKAYKPKYKYRSVFTDDLDTCIITGCKKSEYVNIEIHHIFGAANKTNSECYGFIIPLRDDWHKLACYSIHQDRNLELYWRRKCQDYWLENYGTQEEFIEIFGRWW